MSRPLPDDPRLLDLLVSRATEGLSDLEAVELRRLLADHPELDPAEIELAAAAADLHFSGFDRRTAPPLPADLREKVLADAAVHLRPAAPRAAAPAPVRRRMGPSGFAGWMVAATLLIALVAVGRIAVQRGFQLAPAQPTVAEQRLALIDEPGAIRAAWSRPDDPRFTHVTGDVVWIPERQIGFMRLAGMPINDPTVEQYQLWIVDPSRDAHPVDGGVFDITDESEVIVAIDAKLLVEDAQAFAITLEKPGGVVVSDGPLLVVAPVG